MKMNILFDILQNITQFVSPGELKANGFHQINYSKFMLHLYSIGLTSNRDFNT